MLAPVDRRTPSRWEWLWLGYADPGDLAQVDQIRRFGRRRFTPSGMLGAIRRHPWSFLFAVGSVLGFAVLAFGPWPMQVRDHLFPMVIAVTSAHAYSMEQRRRARIPARNIRRARLRLLSLDEPARTAELAQRRTFWRAAFDVARPNRHALPNLGWVYLAAFALILAMLELTLPNSGSPLLFLGSYWGAALFIPLYTRWQARRDQIRFLADECLHCGYPLADLPSDEPHGAPGWLGPERCSECGCPWPAVPPAVTSKPAVVLALRQQAKDRPPQKLPKASAIFNENQASNGTSGA